MTDPRLEPGFEDEAGLDPKTVEAVGKLSEAFETVEAARGHLYQFHRMSGTADLMLDEAVSLLREAGNDALAERITTELIGLDVIEGRWTFQVVEEYDDGYFRRFRDFADEGTRLTKGHRHAFEARLKRDRQTDA